MGVQILFGESLTTQQLQGSLVVQVNVMKRVGQNFGHPNEACLNILQEKQMGRAKHKSPSAQEQPGVTHSLQKFRQRLVFWQNSKQARVHEDDQGQ
jgi:hypothetical protein